MALVFDEEKPFSPYVEAIWHSRTDKAGAFISSATTRWEMVVLTYEGKTDIAVRGPETKATPADYPADADFFGIVFRIGTFMPHMPVSTLIDRQDPLLPKAGEKSFWMHGSAWQFPTFDNADVFVNRLVRQGLIARDPVVENVLAGQTPLLSLRSLQYRFLHTTGLSHNTIQQIERARRAVTLLQQGIPVLDTVFELGYFDQPHLTRAVKRFYGQTPAQLARATKTA